MNTLKFSEVQVGVKCACPHCNKDIIAEVSDYYSEIAENGYDGARCEFELSAKCPVCEYFFDVDMRV